MLEVSCSDHPGQQQFNATTSTALTVTCVVATLAFGCILHPELKALYGQGFGNIKNTISALDTICAVGAISLSRLVASISKRATDVSRDHIQTTSWRRKLQLAAPPGAFVFVVITLSTWANYLSYEVFALMAPAELVFIVVFSRILHPEEKSRSIMTDVPMVLATAGGTLLLSIADSGEGKGSTTGSLAGAFIVALLCRACQALTTVLLRTCCVQLRRHSNNSSIASVAEIAQWKLLVTSALCLPYALLTEGIQPWQQLLTSSHLWNDTSIGLLVGSVIITIGFQAASVGLNSGLRSPAVGVLVGTLQPLANILLALLLANTSLAKPLGLKLFKASVEEWSGLALLTMGLAFYAMEQLRGLSRSQQSEFNSSLQDQNDVQTSLPINRRTESC